MALSDAFGFVISNHYLKALSILLIAVFLAIILHIIARRYINSIAAKAKLGFQNILVKRISAPLLLLLVLVGLYLALDSIPVVHEHTLWFNRAFFAVGMLILALIVSRLVVMITMHSFRVTKKFEKSPMLLGRVASIIVYLVALLMIMAYYKINITPLIATLGIGGLAIGLALQGTLSNFFAGLHILSDKPIRIGEFIELENSTLSGFVDDIGWRATRIKTLTDKYVIIPNTRLVESIIVNDSYSGTKSSIAVDCGVAYGSNLEKVEKVTLQVAQEVQNKVDGAAKEKKPVLRYNEFADSNINFSVYLWVSDHSKRGLLKHEFIKALKARYDKEKIEISWPVVKLYPAR